MGTALPAIVQGIIAEGKGVDYTEIAQAIVSFMAALIGLATSWLLRQKVPSTSKIGKPSDDDLPSVPAAQEQGSLPSVPVEKYNKVVRLHNDLWAKAKALQVERTEFAKQANQQRKRAERLRLNSRAMRLAIYFAVVSLLLTVFLPTRDLPNATRPLPLHALHQMVGLAIAAFVLPIWLVRDLRKDSPYAAHDIAFTIGLLGLGACGVISMAVSLPYNWERLSRLPSVVANVPLSYFLLVLRVCVFPVLGYFGALLGIVAARQT